MRCYTLLRNHLHVFIGGMPGTDVRGGSEIGGIPGIDIFDIGGKLGNPGKGATPGTPGISN